MKSVTVSVKGWWLLTSAYVNTTFMDIRNEMKIVPFCVSRGLGILRVWNFETRSWEEMALELCVISNCRVNSEKGTDFEKEWFLNVNFLLSPLHKFINPRHCSNITLRINEKITFSIRHVPLCIHRYIRWIFFWKNIYFVYNGLYLCVMFVVTFDL